MASSNSCARTVISSLNALLPRCEGCLRIGRDRKGNRSSDTSPAKSDAERSSVSRESSVHGYTSAQPKVTMRNVPKAEAQAMSIKQQGLPSIKECVSPKQLPIDSPLFGCNLEDEAWCFSSIASRDSCRSDASWKRFLQNFDGSEFAQGDGKTIDAEVVPSNDTPFDRRPSTSGGGEIVPEEDEEDIAAEEAPSNVQRGSSDSSAMGMEDGVRNVDGVKVAAASQNQLSGRKYAGQKKEKMKEYKGDPFSRKTVPVSTVEEDRGSPYRSISPPFCYTTLESRKELPMDEVSSRSTLDLSPELRRKLEMKFVEWNEQDICSSASSIRQQLRHRIAHQSRSAKAAHRKQTYLNSITGTTQPVKTESMRKAAGVHDGRKKRQAKSERWVRV